MRHRSPALLFGAFALAACEEGSVCEDARLAPLGATPMFAVVTSLFQQSSAIALLDDEASLLTEAWVDSGTVPPGNFAALGGDVVFPTTPSSGELVLIERLGVDLITRIDIPSGAVLGQHSTQAAAPGTTSGFRSNPQDALRWSTSELLVSRLEPNFADDAPALDRGNDIVRIDLQANAVVERVAFDALNTTTLAGDEVAYARPTRLVAMGETVVVGLGRLSRGFDAVGEGAVALLHWPTRTLEAVPLPELSNCGEVRPVADSAERVAILCAGPTFQNDAEGRRNGAGIAIVEVAEDGTGTLVTLWRAAGHPILPPPQLGLVSLGGSRFAYTSLSVTGDRTDALVMVDTESGEGSLLGTYPLLGDDALLQFNLGPGVFDATRGTLLVPSATEGLLRFQVPSAEAGEALDPSPCRALPSREIMALAP